MSYPARAEGLVNMDTEPIFTKTKKKKKKKKQEKKEKENKGNVNFHQNFTGIRCP